MADAGSAEASYASRIVAGCSDMLNAVRALPDSGLAEVCASVHRVNAVFQLAADLDYALIGLHRRLMALKRVLDRLRRSALALRQLFKLHRIMLLLLQHLLIHHRSLARLLLQLAHRLLDFAKLLTYITVHKMRILL
ncbi:hypothetical protein DJ90_6051 [Paenibacillus macerans]|uniref:Uncharacterized protein n=1 Tax=Paenibacillus macerans TaxID=44252 RepID=A0A090ZFP3_PAEMA|nr:hypothetical protein DJ90_6051 [Paenibacillus macerans]